MWESGNCSTKNDMLRFRRRVAAFSGYASRSEQPLNWGPHPNSKFPIPASGFAFQRRFGGGITDRAADALLGSRHVFPTALYHSFFSFPRRYIAEQPQTLSPKPVGRNISSGSDFDGPIPRPSQKLLPIAGYRGKPSDLVLAISLGHAPFRAPPGEWRPPHMANWSSASCISQAKAPNDGCPLSGGAKVLFRQAEFRTNGRPHRCYGTSSCPPLENCSLVI